MPCMHCAPPVTEERTVDVSKHLMCTCVHALQSEAASAELLELPAFA
jgi:hypothetical protein